MTTVIECHPPVAAKPAADSKVPKSTTVNGIDTGKLSATIEAIKADASLANFQFRLSNQWVGGGESVESPNSSASGASPAWVVTCRLTMAKPVRRLGNGRRSTNTGKQKPPAPFRGPADANQPLATTTRRTPRR